jgi:hypothetical protein
MAEKEKEETSDCGAVMEGCAASVGCGDELV